MEQGSTSEPGLANKNISLGSRAVVEAIELIRQRYEAGPPADRLAFHNREHTQDVILRAEKVAAAMGIPEKERVVLQVSAAFHDSVQGWKSATLADGRVIRKRSEGANEQASAQEAIAWMEKQPDGKFTTQDYDLVRSAIAATVPLRSAAYGTIVQPALTAESHPVVRALALADLGAAGMDPEAFAKEGDAIFREFEIGIMQAIQQNNGTQEHLAVYRTWIHTQPGFVKGRAALLESELGNLDEAAKQRVRQLFSHFSESVRIAQSNAEAADAYTVEHMSHRLLHG